MPDPLLSEPFVQLPAPRCLTNRAVQSHAASGQARPRLKRVTWPLRASFERWALQLLRARSTNGH
jgi:hypothetical protein